MSRLRPLLAMLAVVAVGATGCITGDRPRLAAEAPTTGSEAVDAVLDRVRTVNSAVFAATYEVNVAFGDVTAEVMTTQAAANQRSLTIGDVRYLVVEGRPRTCDLSTGECDRGLDSARVSDLQMTADFFGTSLAARIDRDAALAVGEPKAAAETIVGREATCVTIPLPAAPSMPGAEPSATYCVFADGVLARLDAADLRVTATSYADEPDEIQFTLRR